MTTFRTAQLNDDAIALFAGHWNLPLYRRQGHAAQGLVYVLADIVAGNLRKDNIAHLFETNMHTKLRKS
jgi:hypothetical protein